MEKLFTVIPKNSFATYKVWAKTKGEAITKFKKLFIRIIVPYDTYIECEPQE